MICGVNSGSQLNDWQIVQSRVCFCDLERKLVNLSLPVSIQCCDAMDGSTSLNVPWKARLRRTRHSEKI